MTKQQLRISRLRKAGLMPVQAWIHKDDAKAKASIKKLCKAKTVKVNATGAAK